MSAYGTAFYANAPRAISRYIKQDVKANLRVFACLATLVALIASRDDANAAQKKVASNTVSTAVLYTDGSIIRLAEDNLSGTAPTPSSQ
jgi:hypothetical protein